MSERRSHVFLSSAALQLRLDHADSREGIAFLYNQKSSTTASDIVAAEGPIAVTIDGRAVREIPGPDGQPFVGNYFQVFPDHLGNHQRLFEKYGPIIKTTNMGLTVHQTNDPTLAAIVFSESDFFTKKLIKGHPLEPLKNKEAGVFLGDTDTEEWRTAHKFLPPAFGPKAVRHYAPTMQSTVEDSFKVFDELDQRDEAWNVYQYMLKLGSQAVGKLVLGLDFHHFTAVDAPLHEMVGRIAEVLSLNKKITSMGSWYAMLPFGDPVKLKKVRQRINEMVNESIERASQGGTEDLELQEAALKASNMVGKLPFCLKPFLVLAFYQDTDKRVIRLSASGHGQQRNQVSQGAAHGSPNRGHWSRLHNNQLFVIMAHLRAS